MREEEIKERLESILDLKFLNKLKEVGKLYGWSGDYCEIGAFIIELHNIKNVDINQKDIEPY